MRVRWTRWTGILSLVFLLSGAAPAVIPSEHPLGQATFRWKETVFIAEPSRSIVMWFSGDLGTMHSVFRDLPGAHDVWVDVDSILHVWIDTPLGERVRRIDLGTNRVLGDVLPGEVHHGSHNCPPPRFETALVIPFRHDGVGDGLLPILRTVSSLINDNGSGGVRELSGGSVYEFGPWRPDEEGRFELPNENWLVIQEILTGSFLTPIPLSSNTSDTISFTIPEGRQGLFVWSRAISSPEGNRVAHGMRVGFVTPLAPPPPPNEFSMVVNTPSITPFGEVGSLTIQTVSGTPRPIRIKAVREPNSGGHQEAHHGAHDGNSPPNRARPFIEFSLTQDPNGVWGRDAVVNSGTTLYFRAGDPGIGGRYFLHANEQGSTPTCPAHDIQPILVRVAGLSLLPETGDGYISVGGTCEHHGPSDRASVPDECKTPNDNHWGTGAMISLVQSISAEWRGAHPFLGNLRINDMALPMGGKFDIGSPTHGIPSGSWGVPNEGHTFHLGHADGRAADIPVAYEGQTSFMPVWRSRAMIRERLHKKSLAPVPLQAAVLFGQHLPGRYIDEGDHFHVMSQ